MTREQRITVEYWQWPQYWPVAHTEKPNPRKGRGPLGRNVRGCLGDAPRKLRVLSLRHQASGMPQVLGGRRGMDSETPRAGPGGPEGTVR